jgi:hypothetical protein
MSKLKAQKDPRGHSLRVYAEVYDSPAFAALSPHDVMAYLALLRELKGYNNGDLSLPLSRAKSCGISHPKTLARSLRAVCAVGLVAITRKGGCTRGGQRLPNLYRMTDRDCYAIPAKHLEAALASHEWKRVRDIQHGHDLIKAVEVASRKDASKTKHLGHAAPLTMAPGEPVKAKTRAPREPWVDELGHGVNMAKKTANLDSMRVTAGFMPTPEKAGHRAPHSTPLYVYQSKGQNASIHEQGRYQRLTAKPVRLFTSLVDNHQTLTH